MQDNIGSNFNKDYYTELGSAVSHILAHKHFQGIRKLSPIIRGTKDNFDKKIFEKNMKPSNKIQKYECAGNLAWINEMYNCLHGVPLNMAMTKELANHSYRSPDVDPPTFTIAADDLSFDLAEHKGALKSAIALEFLHAPWMAVYRDMTASEPDDDTIQQWASWFRMVTFRLKILCTDLEIYYCIENMREEKITEGVVATPSGLQQILKIVEFREAIDLGGKDIIGAPKVYELYSTNIGFSKFSEALSLDYIEKALPVYDKALHNKVVLDLVVDCEGHRLTRRCN